MRRGGINDPKKLWAFFAAKGHENLVLRIVDVLELRNDQQDLIIEHAALAIEGRDPALTSQAAASLSRSRPIDPGDGWRKRWMLRAFPGGYVVIPFARFEALTIEQLQQVQQVCFNYHGVRLAKGEPSRVDPCTKCEGRKIISGKPCDWCEGTGKSITFVEMSDEECAIAARSGAA